MNIAGIVLAAGLGTRLRPLTTLRPKALCPVNNVALLDVALSRTRDVTGDVAVNAHHLADQIVEHVAGTVHVSVEHELLGTAGAIGNLAGWIARRAVLAVNADGWHTRSLHEFTHGWDEQRVRLLVVRDDRRADFPGGLRYAGAALMPNEAVAHLPATFGGLYDAVWEPWMRAGKVDLWPSDERFFDCGTHRDYLDANLAASGGSTVVGEGARVLGRAQRCVLWPGVTVGRDEVLVEAIRARDDVTIELSPRR